jgi:cytochrome b561
MNSASSYTPVAKGLHWLMAVLLIGLLSLGIYMHELPLSPQKLQLYSWHKWAGVTVFVLVWLRLLWRVTHRPPAMSASIPPRMQMLAHLGHAALYAFMIVIPLSGWLMSSAKGVPTVWFGIWPIPDLIGADPLWGERLKLLHKLLNIAFMLTLVGHVGAALWHHFVHKDDTLRRMR